MNKMKIVLLVVGLLCGVNFGLGAQKSPSNHTKAYKPGEKIKYSLNYGFITGGYVTFSVLDTTILDKKATYLGVTGHSAGIIEALYKIRDRYISFIDPETDQPLMSIRDIKEGRYKYYNEVVYHYQPVVDDSIKIHSKRKNKIVKVPSDIQDIVSAFYYARRYNFNDSMKPGDLISFNTYFGDDLFPFKIKYVGIETIKTDFGKIECYLFHPVTEVGRSFKTEEDMKLWISHDKNRIPIRAKLNLVVGSFTCDIEEFEGLCNSFSSVKR